MAPTALSRTKSKSRATQSKRSRLKVQKTLGLGVEGLTIKRLLKIETRNNY